MSLQPSEKALFSPLPPFDDHVEDTFLSLAQPPLPVPFIPSAAGASAGVARNFLQFYGFTANPFADCVNPGFFYRTDSHAEAFRTVMLAVEFDASLGLLTGPSGMGKTLVSQLLLEQLDPERFCGALVLVTPGMSKSGLLREILAELSVPLPVGVPRVQDLVRILSNHIIMLQAEGKRLVLLIDESHFLSADCLQIVRTISNIEVPSRKLVTCLLFGESRLSTRLDHPSFESLRNRIYLRGKLAPLNASDTAQYLKYRLMVAGHLHDLYTPAAMSAIHTHSGGICRTINKLGLLSLIEGAAQHSTSIGEEVIAVCAARM
jgi:general secretion pathway protein A